MKTLFFCFVLLLTFSACHKNQSENEPTTVATQAIALGPTDDLGQATAWGIPFCLAGGKPDTVRLKVEKFASPPEGLIGGNFHPGFGNYIFFNFLGFEIFVDLKEPDRLSMILPESFKIDEYGGSINQVSWDKGSIRVFLKKNNDGRTATETTLNGVTYDRWHGKSTPILGREPYFLGIEDGIVFLINFKETGATRVLEGIEEGVGIVDDVNEKGFFLTRNGTRRTDLVEYRPYIFSGDKVVPQLGWYSYAGYDAIPHVEGEGSLIIESSGTKKIYNSKTMTVLAESVSDSSEYYVTKDLVLYEIRGGNAYTKDGSLVAQGVKIIDHKIYIVDPTTGEAITFEY